MRSKTPPSPSSSYVTIARVLRPQGNRGEVAALLLTDFPERFAERAHLSALFPDGSRRALVSDTAAHWFHKGGVILKFEGVDSISDAELLKGAELQIPATERSSLAEGSYFVSDLVGCTLVDVSGPTPREVGTIRDIDPSSGEAPNLVIDAVEAFTADPSGGPTAGKTAPPKELLIPFVAAFIVKADLAEKRIEMRLPEGLLDVDAPLGKQ